MAKLPWLKSTGHDGTQGSEPFVAEVIDLGGAAGTWGSPGARCVQLLRKFLPTKWTDSPRVLVMLLLSCHPVSGCRCHGAYQLVRHLELIWVLGCVRGMRCADLKEPRCVDKLSTVESYVFICTRISLDRTQQKRWSSVLQSCSITCRSITLVRCKEEGILLWGIPILFTLKTSPQHRNSHDVYFRRSTDDDTLQRKL
jgi:hypothetical protein